MCEDAVTPKVAFPTLMVLEPAALRFAKFVESLGTKSAVKTVDALTAFGIHEHVAVVVAASTVLQPVIAVPAE